MAENTFIGGLSFPQRSDDSLLLLQDARQDSFDFITTNLPHSSSLNRQDVTLIESKWWSTSIVGMVSSPPVYSNSAMETENESTSNVSTSNVSTSTSTSTSTSISKWNFGQDLVTALSSKDRSTNAMAEHHLTYMLDFAAHLNIPACILPPIPETNYVAYGRYLATHALKSSANNVQLWVRVAFNQESLERFNLVHKLCDGAMNLGCIIMFDSNALAFIQKAEGQSSTAASSLTASSSSLGISTAMELLHQFLGCNLRAVSFNTDIFLANKRGFPALPKSVQFLFVELLKRIGRTCRVLVEGALLPLHHIQDEEAMGRSGMMLYLQYLRYIRSKEEVKRVIDTEEARMETGYLDHLQSALQPLGDNLEFSTYEVFEKDPVKYARYQEAVEIALKDKVLLGHLRNEPLSDKSNTIVIFVTIFVVGAGRGPLVTASLKAVDNANKNNRDILGKTSSFVIKPRIVALEKNPSAILYLNSMKAYDPKWGVVEIVECDMRHASEDPLLANIIEGHDSDKVDIVVSELLGSFGDNELSPECLDGFQSSGLMKETGVSIPQSYTSYLAPVTSMRLHAEAQAHAFLPSTPTEGPGGSPCGMLQAMETPYVVRAHAASQLHKELPCWEFNHPIRKDGCSLKDATRQVDNERCTELIFNLEGSSAQYGPGYQKVDERLKVLSFSETGDKTHNGSGVDCGRTIHGFLGTFHCVLYQSVTDKNEVSIISIAPSTFSVGMFSWFPLYFPLRESQVAPSGASVKCTMWRKLDEGRVWYEWCSEIIVKNRVVSISNLHNPNGRSCIVRL